MADSDDEVKAKSRREAILAESLKRFKLCSEAEKDLRELALEDLKFRAGEQWPAHIKQKMEQERKPALTINVLPARERQILNEQRQNRPAIKIDPVDSMADPDTAEVIEGIIRHIEYDSDADVAYDTGSASSTRIGFGFMRLLTEYESPASMRQCIKIKRIRNAFQVYLDPSASEADRSDANFGYIFETFTKDDYRREYPDSELASIDDWKTIGARLPEWLDQESVRIVEYFYKEYRDDEVLQVQNRMGEQRELLLSEFEKIPASKRRGVKIIARRKTEVPVVRWCKHNAIEILEETDWPGRWIPIIPILGDELDVDGKLILEGMVRHAKDPMRMQNYMASKEVQAIALAPNAPYVAAAGQIDNHPEWHNANNDTYSVLVYNPQDVANAQVPPPHREVAEPPIQAITVARAHFFQDFQNVTGIYQAQVGAPSDEKSGKAITARKMQGEISNYHFIDNLVRAIRFLGRQIVDLIPKIYTVPQEVRIIGEDQVQKIVKVNQQFALPDGSAKKYDLTVGRYDVTVSAGPSFQTRRQESSESMIEFLKAVPQAATVTADLVAGMQDWPNHEQFAERLKKLLPPGVAGDDSSEPEAQLQQAKAQLQQLTQQHDQLVQALQHEIKLREAKETENQGRYQIAELQERTKIVVAQITAKTQEVQLRHEMELEQWKALRGGAVDMTMQASDHAHDAAMAAQAAANQPAPEEDTTQVSQ